MKPRAAWSRSPRAPGPPPGPGPKAEPAGGRERLAEGRRGQVAHRRRQVDVVEQVGRGQRQGESTAAFASAALASATAAAPETAAPAAASTSEPPAAAPVVRRSCGPRSAVADRKRPAEAEGE